MTQLRFYTTEGCHLCDEAWSLLEQLGVAQSVEKIDIAFDEVLVEQYGERIPVLLNLKGDELASPFSILDLQKFICI